MSATRAAAARAPAEAPANLEKWQSGMKCWKAAATPMW